MIIELNRHKTYIAHSPNTYCKQCMARYTNKEINGKQSLHTSELIMIECSNTESTYNHI